MRIEQKNSLEHMTSFRMGGPVEKLYIPESIEELITVYHEQKKIAHPFLIGGGSNIIANDKRTYPSVISLKKFNCSLILKEDGEIEVGASVRLQELIHFINRNGYGGIEYLCSVPGLVGGAIVMNAGRGREYNQYIGNYVKDVTVYQDGKIEKISAEKCGFDYRTSAFQKRDCIVLAVKLQFPKMEAAEADRLKTERIDLCRSNQDMSAPNAGSIFRVYHPGILKRFQKISQLGKKHGIQFSEKTLNWILHKENGSYQDVKALILRVIRIHRILGKACETEVILWD